MGYLKVEYLENHFELDVQISLGKFFHLLFQLYPVLNKIREVWLISLIEFIWNYSTKKLKL